MKKKYIKLTYVSGYYDGHWAIYKKYYIKDVPVDGYSYLMCSHTIIDGKQFPPWPFCWNIRKFNDDINIEHITEKEIKKLQFIDCL